MDCPQSVLSDPAAPSVQLPPELWIAVLSQIAPNPRTPEREHVIARLGVNQCKSPGDEVLQNISLTCRSLHDLALPIRFRQVELHAEGTDGSKPTGLYTILSTSEKLRSFVKIVSLWVSGNNVPRLPDSTRDILCGVRNLEDIRIEIPFRMTTPLYSYICSLPSLHRLQVAILKDDAWESNDIVPTDPNQLGIHSLSIIYRGTQPGYLVPKPSGWPPSFPGLFLIRGSLQSLFLQVFVICIFLYTR